jgi:hypothetical protein
MQSCSVSPRAPCRLLVAVGVALLVGAVPATALAQPNQPDGSGLAGTVARTATGVLLADASAAGEQEAPTVGPARSPEGFLPEPRFIGRAIKLVNNRTLGEGGRLTNGFYPEFSNMITGSGWVSIGPGYRHWLFGDRAIVDASTAISWRMYKTAQGRFEFTNLAHSRLAIGSQVRWQDLTQISYFGPGSDSLEADRSQYRMKSTDVVGYATLRPIRSLSIVGRVGWLNSPTILPPGGTFERGYPDARTVFPDDQVLALDEQPSYLHGEASITSDTRDSRSRPSSGGVYRAAWTAYADRDAGAFSFRRYEAEGAQFVPLASRRVVLALHGWVVASDTDAGRELPFYLMPNLGGSKTMRAYSEYRFQDRNLLVATVESRFALMKHVDLAAFVDAGDVAPRLSGLDLGKTSYGLGLRIHTDRATIGRFDVAHGAEGWRFLFRTSDPLHLSRLSQRTAAAPFVP